MKGLMARWPAGVAVHVAHTQNVGTHVTAGSLVETAHRQLQSAEQSPVTGVAINSLCTVSL